MYHHNCRIAHLSSAVVTDTTPSRTVVCSHTAACSPYLPFDGLHLCNPWITAHLPLLDGWKAVADP